MTIPDILREDLIYPKISNDEGEFENENVKLLN